MEIYVNVNEGPNFLITLPQVPRVGEEIITKANYQGSWRFEVTQVAWLPDLEDDYDAEIYVKALFS